MPTEVPLGALGRWRRVQFDSSSRRFRFLHGPLFGQFQFGGFAFGQGPDEIGNVRMLSRLRVELVGRCQVAVGQHGLLPGLHLLRLVLLVSLFQQDEWHGGLPGSKLNVDSSR